MLGAYGWTLPGWASPPEIERMLDLAQDAGSLDQHFVSIYNANRRREFKTLFRALEGETITHPWIPLLRQCRYGYYRGKYLLTVPALLTVLEGLAMTALGEARSKGTSLRKLISERYEERTKDRFSDLEWASIHAFCEVVFARHEFSDDPPTVINRHWILHGRDDPRWTEADVLRLFQAIQTVTTLCA
jgi:hypothetical protein